MATGRAHTGVPGNATGGYVKICDESTDTLIDTVNTIVESSVMPGYYRFTNSVANGLYRLDFYAASDPTTPFWFGWAVTSTTADFTCEDSKQVALNMQAVRTKTDNLPDF